MCGNKKDVKFSMKVMVNKQSTKVLFAEIDHDLADVLLSFLTLPLGQIVRFLKKHYGDEAIPAIGSLTTLYNGLANLSSLHFLTEGCKEMILNPRSSFEDQCRKLKVDISDAQPTRFFTCEDLECVHDRHSKISMFYDVARCPCGKGTLKREIAIIDDESVVAADDNQVFTNKKASFVISDDLTMLPNVAVSVIETLMDLGCYGIADMEGAKLRNVSIGFNEIMDLFKGSLLSRTPLTDLILKKTNIYDSTRFNWPPIILKEAKSFNSNKITLKLMVQECNNKLLFAQAGADFVDFLSSLLTIPLAGVGCLVGHEFSTGLHGLDSLLSSIVHDIENKYLASTDIKAMLMEPKLPHGYLPKKQIIPLTEKSAPKLYYNRDAKTDKEWLSYTSGRPIDQYRKGEGAYVEGPKLYMITDDLTITPLSLTSSFSFLNERKIPLSDVKEVDVQIRLEQALDILMASLRSTSALSYGLKIDSLLKEKQPHKTLCILDSSLTTSTSALTDALKIDSLLEEKQPQRKRKAVSASKKRPKQ